MASFIGGVAEGLRRSACALLEIPAYVFGSVAEIYPLGSVLPLAAVGALRRINGCNPDNDPEAPVPFNGGQCAVQYEFFYDVEDNGGVVQAGLSLVRGGPLNVNVVDSQANQSRNIFLIHSLSQPPGENLVSSGLSNEAKLTNVSVVRLDGMPDICGNPPPVFPPATPINIDIDVTYNIDDGTEVTVTIPFIYAPINVDINGNFRIPFTFEFGGIEFSGNIQLEPNFNVTINPPPAPRGTDSPFTDLPAPDDEIPVEQTPPDKRVVGVVVQSRLVGEQQLTTILTDDIPQILVPRCGSVKFGYAIGTRSFWSPDIDVKDLNCFIPCPFSQGADTVAASPAPGVVLNYSPIFGYALATVADLPSTPAP